MKLEKHQWNNAFLVLSLLRGLAGALPVTRGDKATFFIKVKQQQPLSHLPSERPQRQTCLLTLPQSYCYLFFCRLSWESPLFLFLLKATIAIHFLGFSHFQGNKQESKWWEWQDEAPLVGTNTSWQNLYLSDTLLVRKGGGWGLVLKIHEKLLLNSCALL